MVERGLLRLVVNDNKKMLKFLESNVMRDQIVLLDEKVEGLKLENLATIESTNTEKILLNLV